jgi:hypothetical protein
MKYQYSKIKKKGGEYTIIQPFGDIDGFDVRDLTLKHNSKDQKVIILQKDKVGRNLFSAIDPRNLDEFNEFESFDNLDWETDFIE